MKNSFFCSYNRGKKPVVLDIESDDGQKFFPRLQAGPACLSDKQGWQVVRGYATLVSWVKFHCAYWNSFCDEVTDDVCFVKLDKGPLIISIFRGAAPEVLHAILRLRALFNHVTAKNSLVNFVAG